MPSPYPLFTFIFCRGGDEHADHRLAAFPDEFEAVEHARVRLLRMPVEWTSVVVACGHVDIAMEFCGSWDRDTYGSLQWHTASLA